MKKFKNSFKLIFVSIISIMCLATIALGCFFGSINQGSDISHALTANEQSVSNENSQSGSESFEDEKNKVLEDSNFVDQSDIENKTENKTDETSFEENFKDDKTNTFENNSNTYEDGSSPADRDIIASPYADTYYNVHIYTTYRYTLTATVGVTFTCGIPSRTGYTFKGWRLYGMDGSTHTIGGGLTTTSTTYETGNSTTTFLNLRTSSGDVYIYAMWNINSYSISYNTGDTSFSTAPSTTSAQYNGGNYGFIIDGNAMWSQNTGIHSSYSLGVFKFTTTSANQVVTFYAKNWDTESNYDYGLLSNLDTMLVASYSDVSTNVYRSLKGTTALQTITYTVPTAGEHFISVKYRKDGSASNGLDILDVYINTSSVSSYRLYSNADVSTGFTVPFTSETRTGYTFSWNITGMSSCTHYYGSDSNIVTPIAAYGFSNTNQTYNMSNSAVTAYRNLRSTSGTVTFTATWTPITYTVQFSTGASTSTFSYDTTYTVSNPTRTGYTFVISP